MKVRLNLATAPLEGNRSFLLGAALVGGIGVLAMLFLSWHAFSLYRSNEAARVEEARASLGVVPLDFLFWRRNV